MHVSLTPKLEELIRRKVESGLYEDASDVIREALRLMALHEERQRLELERLREALVAGEQSGFVEDFSMDGLMQQLDKETQGRAMTRA